VFLNVEKYFPRKVEAKLAEIYTAGIDNNVIMLYCQTPGIFLSSNAKAVAVTWHIPHTWLIRTTLVTKSGRQIHTVSLRIYWFLPVTYQVDIRTANFLEKFISSDNSTVYVWYLSAMPQLVSTEFTRHTAIFI